MIKKLISGLLFLSLLPLTNAQSMEELEKLGSEKMSNAHYSEALEYYQQAIALNTDERAHSTIYAYAGICAQEIGDDITAKALYISAIKHGIEEPQVFDNLGGICKQEKDYETQIMAYKAGIERIPGEQKKYQLKLCYIYKKQKDATKLKAMAEAVLSANAQNQKALEYKGSALQYQKKMREAAEVFETLYKLDNKNINANIFLGTYYYQIGKSKLRTSREKYDTIAKPTRIQWHEENKKSKAIMEKYYRPASNHLQTVYKQKPNGNIKKMLYTLYTKLGENEMAMPYKEK